MQRDDVSQSKLVYGEKGKIVVVLCSRIISTVSRLGSIFAAFGVSRHQ